MSEDLTFELDSICDQRNFSAWQYRGPTILDGRISGIMPYSSVVGYNHGGLRTVEGMNIRNHMDARHATIDEDGTVLRGRNGIKVGLLYAQIPDDKTMDQILQDESSRPLIKDGVFRSPFPYDDVIDGAQPPLAAIYHRIVMPGKENTNYAIYIKAEPGVFGESTREVTIRYTGGIGLGFNPQGIDMPNLVERAICGHGFKTGTYTIRYSCKTGPMISIRVDGYRPLFMEYNKSGSNAPTKPGNVALVPLGLDVMEDKMHGAESMYLRIESKEAEAALRDKCSPLGPRFGNSRFLESKVFCSEWNEGSIILVDTLKVSTDKTAKERSLIYNPLSRTLSVLRGNVNPYSGMVEVQVGKVITHTNTDVLHFEPDQAQLDRDQEANRSRQLNHLLGFSEPTMYGFRSMTRGGDISTGFTGFGKEMASTLFRSASCEWIGDMDSFRWLLVNND